MIGISNRVPFMLLLTALALIGVASASVISIPLLAFGALVFICAALAPATPLAIFVILLTLAPLRSLIATEVGFVLPLDIGQLLLLLYLGAWLVDRICRRRPIFAIRASLQLVGAVCLAAILSLGAWQNASLSHWLREWLKWLVIVLIIWNLTLSYAQNWRWLIFAVVISAAANALVGLYIFFGGSGADHLVILGRFFRAFGTFGQPNPFGGFMGIALPIALMTGLAQLRPIYHGWRTKGRLEWAPALILIISSLASMLIIVALLASWSRGAWLGTAVALLVMLVALPRRFAHGVILSLAIGLLFACAWLTGLLPDSIVSRLTNTATELVTISDVRGVPIYPWNYAVIERLAHWQAAVNMATDAPFLGVGLGSYEVVYDSYRLIFWEKPLGHAHNQYLNMLAETGFIGLAAYLGFWFVIIRSTWSLRRHPDNFARYTAVGLLGCWVYIAIHSLFDNLYVNNLFLHIGVLLGTLAILQRQLAQTLELK
ncbi:MAG: O-antigen ligase family protein [Chloroflexi bacterium]|nr:O-antigen ligase family protein [Chloroflexota bacterium]